MTLALVPPVLVPHQPPYHSVPFGAGYSTNLVMINSQY